MERFMSVIVVVCVIAVMICVRFFIKRKRHQLRNKIRDRYIVKRPKRFFYWTEGLSLVEIKRFNKLLNGKYLVEELDGILDFRQ